MELMSENINELSTALSKAQGEIQPAIKDSNNPYFSSKYADLASVWDACRQPLSKNGLSVIQAINQSETGMILTTILTHASGQWIKSEMPLIYKKADPNDMNEDGKKKKSNEIQALGSSLTYSRRYALSAMVGIAPSEDDDGNTAGNPQQSSSKPEASKQVISDKQVAFLYAKLKGHPDIEKDIKDYLSKFKIERFEDILKSLFDTILKGVDDRIQTKSKIVKVG